MLERLRQPFPASDVKQRDGGRGMKLDYIAIETTLGRLLDVAPEYNWVARVIHFEPGGVAAVEGQLTIGDKTATGYGAMKNPDADMALKSANSEAMKNAAKNGWGIALELWDADHRANLEVARRAAGGSEQALKKATFDLAKKELGKDRPTVAEVAKFFGVKAGEMSDADVLRRLLEERGLL